MSKARDLADGLFVSISSTTGAAQLPVGTTAQRPASPAVGEIRYNTTESQYEVYNGTEWNISQRSGYPYPVQYLVIAGGGGGGQDSDGGGMGGGGGAGGYRNSYASETSGGNSSTETPISITPGTQYTITVGAGGSPNAKGGDSTFATITSVGGGRGPAKNTATSALNGGSGGGGPRDGGNGGAGTTGQGFRGGNTGYGAWQGASGGGGAGQVGQVGASDGSPQGEIAGNGGNGLSSSITGSAVTRAGGGGGYNSGAGAGGNGGAGGGGQGRWAGRYAGSSRNSTAGTVNTGSGGGGSENSASSGGSGVVILRMPTAKYSGVTTGNPTVTTVGSDTVLVFNSSGTYTA